MPPRRARLHFHDKIQSTFREVHLVVLPKLALNLLIWARLILNLLVEARLALNLLRKARLTSDLQSCCFSLCRVGIIVCTMLNWILIFKRESSNCLNYLRFLYLSCYLMECEALRYLNH